MSFELKDVSKYLSNANIAFQESPIISGEPINGVVEGRIVAYWPRHAEAYGSADGAYSHPRNGTWRPIGQGRFIPAMIVASWAQSGSSCPSANLKLFLDPSNHTAAIQNGFDGVSSALYSDIPAQGCWTWIPKA